MLQFGHINEKTGEKEWTPGSAFVAHIEEGELQKYETFQLPSTREMELRAFCFAMRNMDAPFHVTAYHVKAIAPWTPGVGQYDPKQNDVRLTGPVGVPYYCTQYTVLLLQAAAV